MTDMGKERVGLVGAGIASVSVIEAAITIACGSPGAEISMFTTSEMRDVDASARRQA